MSLGDYILPCNVTQVGRLFMIALLPQKDLSWQPMCTSAMTHEHKKLEDGHVELEAATESDSG